MFQKNKLFVAAAIAGLISGATVQAQAEGTDAKKAEAGKQGCGGKNGCDGKHGCDAKNCKQKEKKDGHKCCHEKGDNAAAPAEAKKEDKK